MRILFTSCLLCIVFISHAVKGEFHLTLLWLNAAVSSYFCAVFTKQYLFIARLRMPTFPDTVLTFWFLFIIVKLQTEVYNSNKLIGKTMLEKAIALTFYRLMKAYLCLYHEWVICSFIMLSVARIRLQGTWEQLCVIKLYYDSSKISHDIARRRSLCRDLCLTQVVDRKWHWDPSYRTARCINVIEKLWLNAIK